MDEQKLNYLIEKKVGICTSLDGYKEIHDKNRPLGKGTGSFDMVKRWIKPVMEKSPFELNALMVTTKDSLDNMKKIIDEYTGLGFKVIQLKLLNKLGYAVKGWEGIGYEPEEFLDAWKKAMDYILEINKKGTFLCESISRNILREILTDDASPYLDLSSPCGAAIGQMAYDYNGDIYTCDEARMYDIFKLGNVKKDKMSQILSSQEACSIVMASTNESFVCDACVWKPYCGVCPVCAYAERGSIITNIPLSGRCKVLKGIFEYLFDKVLFDKEALAVFNEWITEENKKKS
jgi:radical SAM protein with 4Fe4S-binding SPASM domain